MHFIRRAKRLINLVGEYYAIAMTFWGLLLFVSTHLHFLFWAAVAVAPPLLIWSGYVIRGLIEYRNQRNGFELISDAVTYEVESHRRYVLRYTTKIQARASHLTVFPIAYQWSGGGPETVPHVTGKNQKLLTPVDHQKDGSIKPAPYVLATTEGDWRYSFIALNPPVHDGDVVEIKYWQDFWDEKGTARPILYYFVRVPMKKLELNVKFTKSTAPKRVRCDYIKRTDPSRPFPDKGVKYDSDTQVATWVISNPKRGYCYRIHW